MPQPAGWGSFIETYSANQPRHPVVGWNEQSPTCRLGDLEHDSASFSPYTNSIPIAACCRLISLPHRCPILFTKPYFRSSN